MTALEDARETYAKGNGKWAQLAALVSIAESLAKLAAIAERDHAASRVKRIK